MIELPPTQHARVAAALAGLELNTLFARAVVDGRADGQVLVDAADAPAVVYVRHGYGMSLLFGTSGSAARDAQIAAEVLARRGDADEWLQVAAGPWASLIAGAPAVVSHTRVNFRFRGRAPVRPADAAIVRADRAAFDLHGSVVPRAFWRDAEAFLADGVGYAAIVGGEVASLAFSAFVTPTQLELGIETSPRHRGRGLAAAACAALIDHCLARGLEPVWACRLENAASHRLAEALGFEPVRHLPYFCLTGRTSR